MGGGHEHHDGGHDRDGAPSGGAPGGPDRPEPYATPTPARTGAPDDAPGSVAPYGTRPPPPPPRSRAAAALALGVLGLVLSVLVFPVGLALDIAAIVLGVRELRRAGREGVATPGAALVGLLAAVIGGVLALIITAAVVAFYPQVRSYADCMSGANTLADQQQCRAAFERDVQRRFGG